MLIYAILGTSRQLSMGPFALTCLLVGSTCATFPYADFTPEYIEIAKIVSLIAGCLSFLLGFFKIGAFINFLSPSVLTGFITGSACVISLSQLKYIFGLNIPRTAYSHQIIYSLLINLQYTNGGAFGIG